MNSFKLRLVGGDAEAGTGTTGPRSSGVRSIDAVMGAVTQINKERRVETDNGTQSVQLGGRRVRRKQSGQQAA